MMHLDSSTLLELSQEVRDAIRTGSIHCGPVLAWAVARVYQLEREAEASVPLLGKPPLAKTPVPDTSPRHNDSRQSGVADYSGQAEPAGQSKNQDEGKQGSIASGLGPNPNATGPVMSQPYTETSPTFSEDGFDHTWGQGNKLNGQTYHKGSRPG